MGRFNPRWLTARFTFGVLIVCVCLAMSTGGAQAASGSELWSVVYPGPVGEDIEVDTAGNVYVVGRMGSAVDFGGGTLTPYGQQDLFVAKFDSVGNHIWSDHYGGATQQDGVGNGLDAVVDASANVIITGSFFGAVDFGGGILVPAAPGSAIFAAKYDSDGDHIWSDGFANAPSSAGHAVATDGSGNIIIAGDFVGTGDFGGGPLTATDTDVYVAKFDSTGNHLWSDGFGAAGIQSAFAMEVDPAGNTVVTGPFDQSIDFGGGALTDSDGAGGTDDTFIAKLDATGAHVWSKRFGDTAQQTGTAVTADSLGNVIVAGTFLGSMDFGGGPITAPPGAINIFFAKLDTAGAHMWSKRFAVSLGLALDVATDTSNNIMLAGDFRGSSIDFGGGPFTAPAVDPDGYLAKFDAAGNHTWSKRVGEGAIGGQMLGVAIGPGNHVHLAGHLDGVYIAKFDGAAPSDGDSDGCTDAEESGHYPLLGGQRSDSSSYDFYDVNGTQKVDASDIGLVRLQFNESFPPYDRSAGAYPWAPGPPDGIVNGIDIGLVRASFLHSCQGPPN